MSVSLPRPGRIGSLLARYLENIVPCAPSRTPSRDDRFDPVNNPLGNLTSDLRARTITERGEASHRLGGDMVHPGVGVWVEAVCNVEVPAHEAVLGKSLRLKVLTDDGQEAIALAPFRGDDGSPSPFPSAAWRGALRARPLKLRPGQRAPELSLDVILRAGAIPIEIDIARIDVRPVPSPVRA